MTEAERDLQSARLADSISKLPEKERENQIEILKDRADRTQEPLFRRQAAVVEKLVGKKVADAGRKKKVYPSRREQAKARLALQEDLSGD